VGGAARDCRYRNAPGLMLPSRGPKGPDDDNFQTLMSKVEVSERMMVSVFPC
jgi:hypothetical protein